MHGCYSQPVMWENIYLKYQTGMKLVVLPQMHLIHQTPVLAVVVFLGVNMPRMYGMISLIAP